MFCEVCQSVPVSLVADFGSPAFSVTHAFTQSYWAVSAKINGHYSDAWPIHILVRFTG